MAIKSTIIQECCKWERRRGVRRRNGMGSREGAKITMDVERRQKEFDFFVSCGWITSAAQLNE